MRMDSRSSMRSTRSASDFLVFSDTPPPPTADASNAPSRVGTAAERIGFLTTPSGHERSDISRSRDRIETGAQRIEAHLRSMQVRHSELRVIEALRLSTPSTKNPPPLRPLGAPQPSTVYFEMRREMAVSSGNLHKVSGELEHLQMQLSHESHARAMAEGSAAELRSKLDSAQASADEASKQLDEQKQQTRRLEGLVESLKEQVASSSDPATGGSSMTQRLLLGGGPAAKSGGDGAGAGAAGLPPISAASMSPPPPQAATSVRRHGHARGRATPGGGGGRPGRSSGGGVRATVAGRSHLLRDKDLVGSSATGSKAHRYYLLDAFSLLNKILDGAFDASAPLPRFEELRAAHSELFVERVIGLDAVCDGSLIGEVCCVSLASSEHRAAGPVLRTLRRHLEDNSQIRWVWSAEMCLDGGGASLMPRLESQMLLLGASVLILPDLQYLSSFWPLVEAWLAMQTPTQHGVRPAERGGKRVTVLPIQGASKYLGRCLKYLLSARISTLGRLKHLLGKPAILGVPSASDALERSGGALDELDALVKETRQGGATPSHGHGLDAVSPDKEQPVESLEYHRGKLVELETALEGLEREVAEWKDEEAAACKEHERDVRSSLEELIGQLKEEHESRAVEERARRRPSQKVLDEIAIELNQRVSWEASEAGARVDDAWGAFQAETEEREETLEAERSRLVEVWRSGLMVEGAWFLRWRTNAARMKRNQSRANSKTSLKLQIHSLKESEAMARLKVKDKDAELVGMLHVHASLRREIEKGDAARRDLEEVIRLQRGFCGLRLHQEAKKHSKRTDAIAAEAMEGQMKRLMKQVEKELAQKEEQLEERVKARELEIRTLLAAELRKEISKELEKQLKKREAALQADFRAELTEELEEKFSAEITRLSAMLKKAEQKVTMLQAKQRGNAAHGTK